MGFQIKISGIDENINKHKWIDIEHEDIKEECEYIRYKNNSKRLKHNIDNKDTIDIIENKIKELSLKDNSAQILKSDSKKYTLNSEQTKVLDIIKNKINTNDIITVSGIAGAGKTFTILHIFDELHEFTKNKNICFCAPTNNVVERSKKYKTELEKYFKNVDFCTTSVLLGEKFSFTNNGEKIFKISEKKTNKIFNNDIIVIDEISMMNISQLDYIKLNKEKIGLCILLGDKNQLNPVECDELDILNNSEINLVKNMRCDNSHIHKIHDFIIQNILNGSNINYKKFIYEFNKLLYKFKNNETVYIVHSKNELIDLYLSLYKKEKTIIGNYRNEECEKINTEIKNKIVETENIKCIDNYFINQQIVFKEPYENWNTSEFATIKNIETNTYTFKKIDLSDIINNIQDTNINKYYKKISGSKIKKYFNNFEISDKKLYEGQEVINYLIQQTKTYDILIEIFKYINIFCDVNINILTLFTGDPIRILKDECKKNYDVSKNAIIHKINQLNSIIFKEKKSMKILYESFIIQPLWHILNKNRVEVFAQIESAFSCTIHRLQGCTIDNICVNMLDIFRMTDKKNRLKCLYTCFSRCSNKLIVFMPLMPLCNCDLYCKERSYDGINMWLCNNKKRNCGFMMDIIEDNDECKKCIKCSHIYHKNIINSKNVCLICNYS